MLAFLLTAGSAAVYIWAIVNMGWGVLLPTLPLANSPLAAAYFLGGLAFLAVLANEDLDDTGFVAIITYIVSGFSGLSALSHIGYWMYTKVYTDGVFEPLALVGLLLPIVLCVYTFGIKRLELDDGFVGQDFSDSKRGFLKNPYTILYLLCLLLTTVIYFTSPELTGGSGDATFPSWFLASFFKVDLQNPPTVYNIPQWSLHMKILLGLIAAEVLFSVIFDIRVTKRHRRGDKILVKTSFLAASVWGLSMLYSLRNNLLVHLPLWTFVDIVLGGLIALLLFFVPALLFFPNTTMAIYGVFSDSGSSSSGKRLSPDEKAKLERENAESPYSNSDFPPTFWGPDGRKYALYRLHIFSAEYRADGGYSVEIQVSQLERGLTGMTAKTPQGVFRYW